jgi:outer membrane protein
MRRLPEVICAICAACAFGKAAVAGEPAANAGWTVTLGAEARILPSYEGSKRYIVAPFPIFEARRGDAPRVFRSAHDGASIGIIETGHFRAGPTMKIDLPRRESDDVNLRGLGNVDWTIELGGFAEYWPAPWLRTRAELRQGIGGHDGQVADLSADLVYKPTPKLTLSAGPRLTFGSAAATNPYFSIDARRAAASGLPVYNAGGGMRYWGAGAQARYEWSPQWSGHIFAEYEQLTDGAAHSPLVTEHGSRDQIQVGIGVSYSFDMHGL